MHSYYVTNQSTINAYPLPLFLPRPPLVAIHRSLLARDPDPSPFSLLPFPYFNPPPFLPPARAARLPSSHTPPFLSPSLFPSLKASRPVLRSRSRVTFVRRRWAALASDRLSASGGSEGVMPASAQPCLGGCWARERGIKARREGGPEKTKRRLHQATTQACFCSVLWYKFPERTAKHYGLSRRKSILVLTGEDRHPLPFPVTSVNTGGIIDCVTSINKDILINKCAHG